MAYIITIAQHKGGAGKTSLLKLLMRFYDVRNGAVLVWLTRRRDDFNAEQHTRFRKVAARRCLRLTPVIMLGDTLHASREQISARLAVRLQRSPPTRGLRLRKFSELQIES